MQPVRRRLFVLASATALVIPAALVAQTTAPSGSWPSRPVRSVVPFTPGSTTDILARALAPELGKAFGQTFIVDNKPGAGGNLDADLVAKVRARRLHALDGHGRHASHQRRAPALAEEVVRSGP